MDIRLGTKHYHMDGDHYNGDVVLIGEKDTIVIDGGFEQMRAEAIAEVGRYERGHDGDELEYSEQDVQYYVEQHAVDFVRHCYEDGKFTLEKP